MIVLRKITHNHIYKLIIHLYIRPIVASDGIYFFYDFPNTVFFKISFFPIFRPNKQLIV